MAFAAPRQQHHGYPFPDTHVSTRATEGTTRQAARVGPKGSNHNRSSELSTSAEAAVVVAPNVSPRPKFIHEGKIMTYDGDVFDKLLDPALYTGTHKHRFDAYGRGKGLYGRRDSHTVLDAGAMFEEPGAAEDSATSCWKKSLRAAVHSFTVANQLGLSSGRHHHHHHHHQNSSNFTTGTGEALNSVGGRYSSPRRQTSAGDAARDLESSVSAAAGSAPAPPPPLIQAWSLLDDGRLVFDEARTRELAAATARATTTDNTAISTTEPADYDDAATSLDPLHRLGNEVHQPTSARHVHSVATHGGSSTPAAAQSQRRDSRSSGAVAQPSRSGRKERPADVVKRQEVSSHFRRLLYDSNTTPEDEGVFSGHRTAGPTSSAVFGARATAPLSSAEFLPVESSHSGAVGADGSTLPESLEDIMALVRAYERNPFSSPHAAAEATRRTSGR